ILKSDDPSLLDTYIRSSALPIETSPHIIHLQRLEASPPAAASRVLPLCTYIQVFIANHQYRNYLHQLRQTWSCCYCCFSLTWGERIRLSRSLKKKRTTTVQAIREGAFQFHPEVYKSLITRNTGHL